MPHQDFHFLPRFNGACSILGIKCFTMSSLQQGSEIPVRIGCKVTHSSHWDFPLQIPVVVPFPRYDGAWCSRQPTMLIHTELRQRLSVSQDFHTFIMFGSEVSNLACEAVVPAGWSFKCITAWKSTSVHLAKVVLLVSNLIYCFNIPFFLSTNPIAYGL